MSSDYGFAQQNLLIFPSGDITNTKNYFIRISLIFIMYQSFTQVITRSNTKSLNKLFFV